MLLQHEMLLQYATKEKTIDDFLILLEEKGMSKEGIQDLILSFIGQIRRDYKG